jgi:hypothetical protein
MTRPEFVEAVKHGRRYRVYFTARSSWIATVLIDGGDLRLYYPGPHRPPQTFKLVPDRDGHLVVDGKDWGRLEKVTLARTQRDHNGDSSAADADRDSPERVVVSIRVPSEQLSEIDRRAKAAGYTRSEFMLHAALGADPIADRLSSIEQRIQQLEVRQPR